MPNVTTSTFKREMVESARKMRFGEMLAELDENIEELEATVINAVMEDEDEDKDEDDEDEEMVVIRVSRDEIEDLLSGMAGLVEQLREELRR